MTPLDGKVTEAASLDAGTLQRQPWRTTVGLKVVMAATGIVLIAFLVFHLVGNLLVYRGPSALNEYSAFLVREAPLLWTARVVLLASVVLHITSAARLWARDRAARPIPYGRVALRSATIFSRTIRLTGIGLALFILFHLLHLSAGLIEPVPFDRHDVYGNVVGGFRVGWVTAVYLVAMVLLGMHVVHGAWASLRSVGASRPSPRPKRRPLAWIIALALWGGFTSIPLTIWLGALER